LGSNRGETVIDRHGVTRALRTSIVVACCLGAAPATWAQPAAGAAAVTGFEVTGNTLLPAAEIDKALASFKGRRSLADLQQAAEAVQELYRRAGYGAVIAYLPEQRASDGVIRIAVLEGKIARVVVTGSERHPPEAIRRALPLIEEGRTPNVRAIDRQVQLANENPARQLAVTLEAGAEPGAVDVRIHVTEGRVIRWSLLIDNTGDDRTGRWRAALAWRHDNVAGRDHQASLQVQTSPTEPSDVVVVSGNYSVPLVGPSMRLDGYFAYSDVDGGATATPVGTLSFSGEGHVVGARLTALLPRRGELEHRASISLDRRDYLNDCRIAGLPPGACGTAGESVTATPLTVEYSAQRAGAVPAGGYLNLSGNLGLGGRHAAQRDFDAVRAGAPKRYTVWRLGAFAQPRLDADWGLRARIQAQLGGDALITGEQFGLAGAGAVRGYEEREVIGDAGYLASVELVSPELLPARTDPAASSLRVSLFGDGGQVMNRLSTECRQGHTRCTLAAAGLGLAYMRGPGQLRLDLARAGRDGTQTDRGDWKLHLAASWALP
jgi:hemolysin activation/secretion protein